MAVEAAGDQLAFGIIVSDGKNYTVEIAKEKETVIKQRKGPSGAVHRCTVYCDCRKIETKKEYKIKIMSRYSTKFVRSFGIDKPGNKRNHSIISKSKIQTDRILDIQTVNAFINVMEEQILKDIVESRQSGTLIKRSAKQIHKLKMRKYGGDDRMKRRIATTIDERFALLRLSESHNNEDDQSVL